MQKNSFKIFLEELRSQNKVFVSYKFPNSDLVNLIVQENDILYTTSKFNEEAFVFAPFDMTEETVIIPFNKTKIYTFSLNDVIKDLKEFAPKSHKLESSLSQEDYTTLIEKAKTKIDAKNLQKVVLSRRIKLDFENKNTVSIFLQLLKKHPSAFTYLWQHPKVGVWLGATPEKLLSVKENKLETMALAGTQLAKNESDLIWKSKEKQEQQFVTDYISKTLSGVNIPVNIGKSFNLKAGNLWHICTKITGTLTHNFAIKNLIGALHPTPAVAGLPKQKAIAFILENECYKRSFYTGFLGTLNKENESKLFVNLRCMQIENKKAFVYVGGGITADSNAESEWCETEAKSQTLLQLL
jgi:isochorismate synthase